ncbi:MAG: cbb3-type cytochrome c oxidase subunit 3 [Gammaproteobacteria bacterium]|nr:cbb3-type cytochrome c oxidase subunit 3 [Gammaproteobacteria bacterium]MCP5317846.1 cbb3-type cytochrome c oxidase subunit 3 [Chromatiaceae bacterium]MCB1817522.1 cbb3-type cytochrome c oxidase subunit 3 [Gammaproteobacteria bacterium]MCP5413920.1 cbb3-type cytochrome c oxidase subunit 3 [Chromatiaceae bacterium]MCP5429139.1 cbb3-type cytochrome c oxidase subunit 3 [Chromatiaceae bacterium]
MMQWLSNMENTKPLALVIFFVVFVGILLYVFANKKRSKRLESYKNIPFLEDDEAGEQKDKDSRNG